MPTTRRTRIIWSLLVCAAFATLVVYHTIGTAPDQVVVKVISGHSLMCADGRILQLAGMDASQETMADATSGPKTDPSRDHLAWLVEAKAVRIVPGRSAQSTQGPLVYVYRDEVLINGRMIKDGFAKADPRRDYPERELFLAYESQARMRGLGIWSPSQ